MSLVIDLGSINMRESCWGSELIC